MEKYNVFLVIFIITLYVNYTFQHDKHAPTKGQKPKQHEHGERNLHPEHDEKFVFTKEKHFHKDHEHFNNENNHMHHENEGRQSHNNAKHSQGHEHHHHHTHSHSHKNIEGKVDMQVCINAVLSTLLISIAPIAVIFLMPNYLINNMGEASPGLNILLSFAAGGLLGDALLHLIPHALLEYAESLTIDPSHASYESEVEKIYNIVGIRVLSGILLFLAVDKVIRAMKIGSHSHHHSHDNFKKIEDSVERQSTTSSTISDASKISTPSIDYPLTEEANLEHDNGNSDNQKEDILNKGGLRQRRASNKAGDNSLKARHIPSESGDEETDQGITHSVDSEKEMIEEIRKIGLKTSAYLNLAADFAHNFTDGLAISASFMAGNSVGILATSTILLHEVPHEIGDYAILIQSGCSRKKAVALQFLTAIGALTGTVLGLLSKHYFHQFISTLWILPFTAGGFIYIATVTILPELLNNSESSLKKCSLWQTVKELLALLLGILFMVVLIYYE